MNNRRTFIKQSGMLSAGILIDPSVLFKKQKNVGIQLYTLRELVAKDPKAVIENIAKAGYKEVEMFGLDAGNKFFGFTAAEFAALLKTNGLASPSGHYTPEKFLFENGNGDDVKRICDACNALGNKYFIIPWLSPEKRKTIDQYKILADRINKAAVITKEHGLQMAYHNHDFEFENMNGETGYSVLLGNTDTSLVKFEMDIYWVIRAGYDPVALFKQNPGRFHLWHVKDMNKSDKTQNTEVGNGSVDFKTIFANARLAGVKHYMMEQENNYQPDFYGSIKSSCSYIKSNLLK